MTDLAMKWLAFRVWLDKAWENLYGHDNEAVDSPDEVAAHSRGEPL